MATNISRMTTFVNVAFTIMLITSVDLMSMLCDKPISLFILMIVYFCLQFYNHFDMW
jgi:hypothetical protein